jgi:hypothetical protein
VTVTQRMGGTASLARVAHNTKCSRLPGTQLTNANKKNSNETKKNPMRMLIARFGRHCVSIENYIGKRNKFPETKKKEKNTEKRHAPLSHQMRYFRNYLWMYCTLCMRAAFTQ